MPAHEQSRHIPARLRRAVMVEAGHRCAIPTCRGTSALEIHHIEDWVKVREHTFENLICLCAVCHRRATNDEIDRLAMLQDKSNLAVVNDRYGEFERRILDLFVFAEKEPSPGITFVLEGNRDSELMCLLRDGLLEMLSRAESPKLTGGGVVIGNRPHRQAYRLTNAGAAFVQNLRSARNVL